MHVHSDLIRKTCMPEMQLLTKMWPNYIQKTHALPAMSEPYACCNIVPLPFDTVGCPTSSYLVPATRLQCPRDTFNVTPPRPIDQSFSCPLFAPLAAALCPGTPRMGDTAASS